MGFIDKIKKAFSSSETIKPQSQQKQPELQKIGIVQSICPYCGVILEKKPSRKKKCPDCNNFIYVRTRPVDSAKVLVTEEQLELIEEQRAIVQGTYDEYLAEKKKFEEEKQVLTRRFGHIPSDNDVKWSLLNKQSLEDAQNGNWGLYRNNRFAMAEILWKEERLKAALQTYLEVCYLDLNGPNNTGGLRDPQLLKEYPPFSSDMAFLVPAVVDRASKIIKKLGIDEEEVKQVFFEMGSLQHKNLKLPVSPKQAWNKLEVELLK